MIDEGACVRACVCAKEIKGINLVFFVVDGVVFFYSFFPFLFYLIFGEKTFGCCNSVVENAREKKTAKCAWQARVSVYEVHSVFASIHARSHVR